jgi:hypothetical protein
MTAASVASQARPATPVAARVLGGLTLAMILAAVALTVVTGDLGASSDGSVIALAVGFLAVGFLVALRLPRNPVGWVLLVTGLSAAFTIVSALYVQDSFQQGGGGLPLWRVVMFAESACWAVSPLVGMTALLLFPGGHLSRAWRRVLRAYAVVSVMVLVTQAIPVGYAASLPRWRFDQAGNLVGHYPGGALAFFASGLPVLAAVPFWLSWIVRLVIDFRRSTGDVRQQYKWFTAGAAICLAGLVTMTLAESGSSPSAQASAVAVAATYAVVAFPLGMGLGILRYRLYEIDRLVSRTVAYALVTGLLIGVYAGLVLLATQVLGFASTWAVAGSTLAAAALFTPLRRRVQRVVDGRFNRARYDADAAVTAFSGGLQDAVDLDAVRSDLLTSVAAALEPAHVSVWLRRDRL